MFTGEHSHTFDSKGRIAVPAEMRDVLRAQYAEVVYVTRSLHGPCLWAFPEAVFQDFMKRVAERGLANPRLSKLGRRLFAPARKCPLDRTGRVLIPEKLREAAGLTRDAVFLGMGNHIEIWSPEQWTEEEGALDLDDSLDAMAELGL